MKPFLPFILFSFCTATLFAQSKNDGVPPTFFDPQKDPIALRNDTVLHLLVSEYVLAKSVKTRLGTDYQVTKTWKSTRPDEPMLFLEGHINTPQPHSFTLAIPLVSDVSGRFYYASSQALVCSSPGCSNCSILHGACVGCCASAVGNGLSVTSPLVKIQTSIDE